MSDEPSGDNGWCLKSMIIILCIAFSFVPYFIVWKIVSILRNRWKQPQRDDLEQTPHPYQPPFRQIWQESVIPSDNEFPREKLNLNGANGKSAGYSSSKSCSDGEELEAMTGSDEEICENFNKHQQNEDASSDGAKRGYQKHRGILRPPPPAVVAPMANLRTPMPTTPATPRLRSCLAAVDMQEHRIGTHAETFEYICAANPSPSPSETSSSGPWTEGRRPAQSFGTGCATRSPSPATSAFSFSKPHSRHSYLAKTGQNARAGSRGAGSANSSPGTSSNSHPSGSRSGTGLPDSSSNSAARETNLRAFPSLPRTSGRSSGKSHSPSSERRSSKDSGPASSKSRQQNRPSGKARIPNRPSQPDRGRALQDKDLPPMPRKFKFDEEPEGLGEATPEQAPRPVKKGKQDPRYQPFDAGPPVNYV